MGERWGGGVVEWQNGDEEAEGWWKSGGIEGWKGGNVEGCRDGREIEKKKDGEVIER